MTKQEIKAILTDYIDKFMVIVYEDTSTLTQEHLTSLTDEIADELSKTVNPNGPHYPSTPR